MITAVVSYTRSFEPLAEFTVPVLRRYCGRHGYDLIVHRGGFGYRNRQFGFQKTELVRALLRAAEALFVVDADTLVTNHSVRLESFLDDDHAMFACHDENGFNAGSYLIRNTSTASNFLEGALHLEGAPGVLCEQDAMRDLLKKNLVTGGLMFPTVMKVLPHPAINSYRYDEYGKTKTREEGQWHEGDFLLHLPGMTNERRLEIFRTTKITE